MKGKNIIKQFFDFGLGSIICLFISMLTVPITTRIIAPEEYGKTSMFGLIQTIFNLFALFGCDQAYTRFFYDEKDKKKLLYNCLAIPVIFCFIGEVIIILFKSKLSFYLFGQDETLIMTLISLYFPLLIFNSFLINTIRMEQKGKLFSFLQVFSQLTTFCSLLLLFKFYSSSFRSIIISSFISCILTSLLLIIFCRKYFSFKFLIDFSLLKKILLFALPLVPSSLLTWIMTSFDKISIRNNLSFEDLGLYSAAFKIVTIINIIRDIFCTTWIPVAYKWHSENRDLRSFEMINKIISFLMVFIFSLIIIFRFLIFKFLGPQYRNIDNIFIFLLYTPIFYVMGETTGLGLVFSKKTILILLTSIASAVLNILGNFLLVPKYGAVGAAVSTAICYSCYFWIRTLLSRKNWFKFDLTHYFINHLVIVAYSINMVTIKSKIIEVVLFLFVFVFNLYSLSEFSTLFYEISNLNIGKFRKLPFVIAKLIQFRIKKKFHKYNIQLSTYDGSNQCVHPDMIKFNNKVFLTVTPYPFGNDYYENPIVFLQNKNQKFNLLTKRPVSVSDYNNVGSHCCDPCFYEECGKLYIIWLDVLNYVDKRICRIYYSNSLNGKNWSKKKILKEFIIFQPTEEHYLCPALIKENNKYVLFVVNTNLNKSRLLKFTSDSLRFDEVNSYKEIMIDNMPEDYYLWHINVCSFLNYSKTILSANKDKLLGVFTLKHKYNQSDYINVYAYSKIKNTNFIITEKICVPSEIKNDICAIYKSTVNPENGNLIVSYRDNDMIWKLATVDIKAGK